MFKINTPGFRVISYVGAAAIGALHAGEALNDYTPSPKSLFGIATATSTTSTAGTLVLNTVSFSVVEVTPPAADKTTLSSST